MTITIPAVSLTAMRDALEKCNGGQQFFINEVEPAAKALLNAWPGIEEYTKERIVVFGHALILPLPQEKTDG